MSIFCCNKITMERKENISKEDKKDAIRIIEKYFEIPESELEDDFQENIICFDYGKTNNKRLEIELEDNEITIYGDDAKTVIDIYEAIKAMLEE